MTDTAPPASETRSFDAEVSRLLHLMVHSVYSRPEIFLRELVSNAADACERLRTLSLDRPDLLGEDASFRVRLVPDAKGSRLTVEDNGIGMDRQELIDNLGTIARSGTKAFIEGLGKSAEGSALIGQFGVGFYSAFMVADRVDVFSAPALKPGEAWHWSSDGKGAFTVEPADPADAPKRGTRIVLHLSESGRDYADPDTLERIVEEYSAHINVPIVLRLEDGATDKTLADGTALWRLPKSAVRPEEYASLYRHIAGDFAEPALTLHYRAEGRSEYSVLLFVPAEKPLDLFAPERRGRLKLYVRRVFITDEADILPPWLRFVRGVIDSEDLPLNLSREMLQKDPALAAIGKAVTTRLLAEFEKTAREQPETFARIWDAFAPVLKEGLYEDPARRDALFKLARFKTTAGEGWRSLGDYLAALKPSQTAIYYALGDSEASILASPHLEGYRQRGVEVLLLSDPIDAFWVRTSLGFEGKPFKSVTQGAADLSLLGPAETKAEPANRAAVATLAARFKEALGDRVSAVTLSERLTDSPVCLVAADSGLDRQLERLLVRQGDKADRARPVLEINPGHKVIAGLAERFRSAPSSPLIDDAALMLYAEACILDGEPPPDAAEFGRGLDRLIEAALKANSE
ncbi:MAG: molecular chaperone HtpG [Bauldia sp.]|nr:molecular chaperone HtpG [Bauldia sp.]